jgi:hypothetical protein
MFMRNTGKTACENLCALNALVVDHLHPRFNPSQVMNSKRPRTATHANVDLPEKYSPPRQDHSRTGAPPWVRLLAVSLARPALTQAASTNDPTRSKTPSMATALSVLSEARSRHRAKHLTDPQLSAHESKLSLVAFTDPNNLLSCRPQPNDPAVVGADTRVVNGIPAMTSRTSDRHLHVGCNRRLGARHIYES